MVRIPYILTNSTTFDIPKCADWCYIHSAKCHGRVITFDGIEQTLINGLYSAQAHSHYDTCLVHYALGSMVEFIDRCKRWGRNDVTSSWRTKKWTFERFVAEAGDVEDARMMIYADEMRHILADCSS